MKTEKTIYCNGCGRRIGKDENGVMEEIGSKIYKWVQKKMGKNIHFAYVKNVMTD